MKRNISQSLMVGLLTLSLLTGSLVAACAKPAPAEVIEWRIMDASATKMQACHTELKIPFAEAVAKRSKGRLKLSVYLNAELGYKGTEGLRVLQSGAVEMGDIGFGWNAGDMPILGIGDLPLFYKDQAEFVKGWEAALPIWQRELAKWDVIPIGIWMNDEMIISSRKPLRTIKDFEGLKIRCYYAELSDLMEALGASPVFVPFPEQYTALQRGVVDATITGATTSADLKLWEVVDYGMIGIGYAFAPFILAVSKTHWDKLPKDLQEIVLDEAKKLGPKAASLYVDLGRAAVKDLEAGGVQIVTISPQEREQIQRLAEEKVWPKWAEKAGPVGKELVDTILKAIR